MCGCDDISVRWLVGPMRLTYDISIGRFALGYAWGIVLLVKGEEEEQGLALHAS